MSVGNATALYDPEHFHLSLGKATLAVNVPVYVLHELCARTNTPVFWSLPGPEGLLHRHVWKWAFFTPAFLCPSTARTAMDGLSCCPEL